jgi:beta-lactamase regulating signal transducer with metallopeptidase domain
MTSVLAALVNGGILSALVTIAVWLALRVTPRRVLNAATRYAMWWAALAIAVTLPALYLPRDVEGAPPVEDPGDSL